jgi:hypothetical protein
MNLPLPKPTAILRSVVVPNFGKPILGKKKERGMKAREELLNITRFHSMLTSTDMIDENACLGLVPHCFIKVASHLTLRKGSHTWTAEE